MTAMPAAAPAPVPATTAPVPFWRLTLAEVRKSFDTRAGMWLLISIGIIVGIVEVFMLIVSAVNDSGPIYFADFALLPGIITSLLLPVLAILLVTSEWSQRSAMVTFCLEPRRLRVILAKGLVAVLWALATIVVMLVIGLVVTAASAIINPDSTSWTGSDDPGVLPFAVVQVLTMATGFAIACLLLNTPAAIVVFFLYWYMFPGILAAIGLISDGVQSLVEWLNFRQASEPFLDGSMHGDDWGKLIVSVLFAVGLPLGFGLWRVMRAEVK